MAKYSVLMSLYKSENPNNFKIAVQSILDQDLPASEFVIVCDGPLTEDLDKLLSEYEKFEEPKFKIIRLQENKGLGNALNIGLSECSNEFVLRMDTDDIASKDRATYEVKALEEGYDIVGGYVSEFEDGNEEKIICVRKVPLTQEEIYKYVKKRCPFSHPSVAYRKSFILKTGNYSNLRKAQDWELWVRCIKNEAKVKNFDKVFINMRSGKELLKRRGGKIYIRCHNYILKEIRSYRWVSFFGYHKLRLIYGLYAIMPMWLKNVFTNSVLRK